MTEAAAPLSQPGPSLTVPPPRQRRSRRLLKRFLRRRLSVFGLFVLVLILGLAVFAPLFGRPSPLPKAQIRLCSRNRPMIDLTVIVSDKPGIPGRRQQIPRTISTISTPAWLAS